MPNKLLSFLEAQKTKDFHQWLHFYIDDFHFDKVWFRINQFIEMFKRFDGIILPDFSVYRDMPLCMQYWNIYRSRALGCYLQSKGIKVIPNVRYGDERTYDVSTLGLSYEQTIAIGTNGVVKNLQDRHYLEEGFDYIVNKLHPKNIIIYGSTTKHIEEVCNSNEINIIHFRSTQFDRYGGE